MGYTFKIWLYILSFPACWPVYAIGIRNLIRLFRR